MLSNTLNKVTNEMFVDKFMKHSGRFNIFSVIKKQSFNSSLRVVSHDEHYCDMKW